MSEEVVLDVGGRATRIVREGTGPALVWLHDTLGNRWTPAQAALAARYDVIAPSLPGFDDSATLPGIDAPEDVVFWLVDLLHELQLHQAVMVGCGLGGWMAAEFAVRYPNA